MGVSVNETVLALNTAITALLPPQPDPDLVPDILINPVKTHPAGLGGYVGQHPAPMGEILARRLKAQVVIRVKADKLADLEPTESQVTNALVGADSILLRSLGIYRIARDTGFSRFYNGTPDGITVKAGKDIRFDIDFEFRQLPSEAEGVISAIPLDLLLNSTGNRVTRLFDADFDSDPLSAFTALDDDSTSNGPGHWTFNGAEGRVEQDSTISGGSNAFNASKRGTYLVLNPSQVPRLPAHFLLQVELGADSGGIGVVFNFQDVDNFHFFIMSLPTPYRLLGKKVAGSFAFLDQGGQDEGNAYSPGDHSLRLVQQNGELQVALDFTPILNAREEVLPVAGSVGFLSRNCASARFRSMRWWGL